MGGMRALVPPPDPDRPVDLHEHYARDWAGVGGLRIDFVSSADGAGTVDGASAGLQTPGDNRVFATLRDLADVVLVGAGTARDEGYRPAHPSPEKRELRRSLGMREALTIALVSRSLRLDPATPLFADADPDSRTVVITCAAADPAARAALEPVADVIVCGDDDVDLVAARDALAERGLRHVVGEGGPRLFADLVAAGVVDELCLSLTPFLAGPGAPRIVGGEPFGDGLRRMDLVGLLEEDGALFCRYRLQSRPA